MRVRDDRKLSGKLTHKHSYSLGRVENVNMNPSYSYKSKCVRLCECEFTHITRDKTWNFKWELMRSQTLTYGYEIFGVCVCVFVWILNILRKPTRRYNQVYVYKERVESVCECMYGRTYVRMGSYLHLYGFARTTTTTRQWRWQKLWWR